MREECLSSTNIQEWKKVKRIDSEAGDLMCANAHSSGRGVRDSSYIRVFFLFFFIDLSLTVAQYQVPDGHGGILTYYGRLEHIITITLTEAHRSLQPSGPATSIFALIHRCILKEDDPQLAGLDIHFFSKEKQSFDVVDITSVQCLVGRVNAGRNSWAIIDRSGKLAQAMYEEQGIVEQETV